MEPRQSIHVISEIKSLTAILKLHKLIESKIFILADSHTVEHCLPIVQEALPDKGKECIVLKLNAGEAMKDLNTATHLYDQLLNHEADRQSLLLNVGGGVICDLGGFVASTYKRGMHWINIPTTVLSQVDAAIGGKTGVNHQGFKNMVGTFNFPTDTVIYPEFFNTLPKREVMSGFAEMIKHALIASPELWDKMVAAPYIDLPFIKSILKSAMEIKVELVAQDFKESGVRKKLNYGHTVGHALESYMMESPEHDLLHGEAVALGLIAESHISFQKGYITDTLLQEISALIAKNYDGLDIHDSQFHRLIEIMRQDKKAAGGKMNMTLIKGVGDAIIDRQPAMDMIIESLTYLMRYPFKK